jgi:small-conductance mechanosensitive channel
MNLAIKLQDWPNLVFPLLIIIGCLLLGWVIEKRVIGQLLKLSREKNFRFSEGILRSIRGLSLLWFGILGVSLALSLPNLPLFPAIIGFIKQGLLVVFLISATLVVAQVSVEVLRVYTTGEDGISPLTTLFEFLAKVVIFSCGFLIVLGSLGISITPLLTAFGIGGVSIGLALQGTLANLMSGITIITSKKVRVGDYIQLKTGEAGYVRDVELKYTVIEEITRNLLVIPNTQILSSSFRNYSLPDRTLLIPVEIGVSYDSDLDTVEKITLEVAREVSSAIPDDPRGYRPFIRYGRFDYYSIPLTVYLAVIEGEFFDHLTVKHEFIKRLHKRYRDAGITLPVPMNLPYLPTRDRPEGFNDSAG